MTSSVPAGRYPIRPTQRDLSDLKESILGVATPETLDTLSEIAAAIGDDPNYFTNIAASIQAVQDDVDANEIAAGDLVTNLQAARALITDALSSRLDTLEADPTTATAVSTVQAELDTEESTRATNDAALSVRIDALEVDPTTQTAVDTADALRVLLDGSNIPGPYANDADAESNGVAVGALYKHNGNGQIHFRVS